MRRCNRGVPEQRTDPERRASLLAVCAVDTQSGGDTTGRRCAGYRAARPRIVL